MHMGGIILFGCQYINVLFLELHPSVISLVTKKGKNTEITKTALNKTLSLCYIYLEQSVKEEKSTMQQTHNNQKGPRIHHCNSQLH